MLRAKTTAIARRDRSLRAWPVAPGVFRLWTVPFAVSCCAALPGCWIDDCEPPAFDEGEQFRITILQRASEPGQDCTPLKPGDSFQLTAAEWQETEQCRDRSANVANFKLGDVDFTVCANSIGRTLGFSCWNSVDPNTCGPKLGMEILSEIQRNDTVIDDAQLRVAYVNPECTRSCVERFVVRLEILNRL